MAALGALAMEAFERAMRRIRQREGCRNRQFWSVDEEQLLRERYPHEDTASIAADLGRPLERVYSKAAALGLHKSAEFMVVCQQRCGQQRAETGRPTRFKPGMTPWNKGLKGLPSSGRMKETQFGKGNKPHTWVPVGTEQVRDGYLYRKMTDFGGRHDWKLVHVMLWVEHNGPVPEGHCLSFRDGNKQNITLDNLELITRAERMRRNTIHRYPPELKDAIRAVGRLKRTIREIEHEKQS